MSNIKQQKYNMIPSRPLSFFYAVKIIKIDMVRIYFKRNIANQYWPRSMKQLYQLIYDLFLQQNR